MFETRIFQAISEVSLNTSYKWFVEVLFKSNYRMVFNHYSRFFRDVWRPFYVHVIKAGDKSDYTVTEKKASNYSCKRCLSKDVPLKNRDGRYAPSNLTVPWRSLAIPTTE